MLNSGGRLSEQNPMPSLFHRFWIYWSSGRVFLRASSGVTSFFPRPRQAWAVVPTDQTDLKTIQKATKEAQSVKPKARKTTGHCGWIAGGSCAEELGDSLDENWHSYLVWGLEQWS